MADNINMSNASDVLCSCDPPAYLSIRRSKKYNNLGRFYYCCRNSNPRNRKGCGFFMWQEDAQRIRSEGRTVTRPQPNQTRDNNRSDSTIPLQKRASQNGSQNNQAASSSNQQFAAGPNFRQSATETRSQHETIDTDTDEYKSTCPISQSSNGSQVMPDDPDDIDANDFGANDVDSDDVDADDVDAGDVDADDIDDDDDDSRYWQEASQMIDRAEAAQAATLEASKTAQPSSYRPISAPVFLDPLAAGNRERIEGSRTTVPSLSYFGSKPTTPTRAPLPMNRSSSPPRSPRHNSHDTAASTSWARVPQRDVTPPPQQSTSRGFILSAAAPPHPSTPTRGGGTALTSLMTPQKTPIQPGAQNFQAATKTAPPQFQLGTPIARPLHDTPTSRPGAQSFQAAARPSYPDISTAESSPFAADKFSSHPALSGAEEYLKIQDRRVFALTKSKEALTRRNEDLVKELEDIVKELEVVKKMLEEEKREKDTLKAENEVIKVEIEALKKDRRGEGLKYDGNVGWGGSGFGTVKRARRAGSRD
ncbi:hypothetical protein BC937DRAFT_92883 [Endogone sp. FLAS-F59071]|nr:hypothetical protein BC937DRAFT_92883 [Endogone sp. FLAS-F59071]|eukprot:RUS15112.1 hypothetical protein BC937DRAFT_92883 [Endogone sp. FLAS-F59071]